MGDFRFRGSGLRLLRVRGTPQGFGFYGFATHAAEEKELKLRSAAEHARLSRELDAKSKRVKYLEWLVQTNATETFATSHKNYMQSIKIADYEWQIADLKSAFLGRS